ncbi:MAG: hypothetical protein KDA63_17305 [Planctomycetales bacterium]|nr:hypothetical protein [Planctomycetales bacterium]
MTKNESEDRTAPTEQIWLGWCFLAVVVVLIVILIWLMCNVVAPLTQQTALSTKIVDAYVEDTRQVPLDEDTVRLLLALEYAAAAIRTVNAQIAFATTGGFFLIVVGVLMFAFGVTHPFDMEVHGGATFLTFRHAAPGIVAVLFGAAIMALGVTRDVAHGDISFTRRHQGTSTSNAAIGVRDIPITNDAPPEDATYMQAAENGSAVDDL